MEKPVSVANWSIGKLLDSIPNAFEKAKAKILFVILLVSLIKIIVGISVALIYEQPFQIARGTLMLCSYLLFIKLVLAGRKFIKPITHCMINMGLLLVWTNIFISAKGINLITIQFIFMLILSSFYLLNTRFALMYVALSILPVVIYFIDQQSFEFYGAQQLASPGYEIIIVMNFITIVVSHYLFQQAFADNLKEKDVLNIKLVKAVQDANRAAESKSDFLSTMSHELRTPLNSVIGITNLLLSGAHTPEQKENLNILKFSSNNLNTLINDILDFNKLGAGKLDLEMISVDLNELLQNLGASLGFQAKQKGIDFYLEVDDAILNKRVISDPTRLTQIVYNLAGNAIKFTHEGSVTLRLKVDDCNDTTVYLKISIIDTGIGISEEQKKVIFEPFMQASSSITRTFGGTGLGLAIVKNLLDLFNSVIHLDSHLGKGSVFSFDLALSYSTVNPTKAMSDQGIFDLEGMSVLVADDNPMNRLLVKKILSTWNCNLQFAENGEEAIQKLTAGDYDIILMDLHMPVLDGYNASRLIRELPDPVKANIPIIALTASVAGNLYEKIKMAGMNDYVLKPFRTEDLYVKIKSKVFREW